MYKDSQIINDSKKKSQGKLENTLMNENKSTMQQNLWDAVKAVLRGKFIALKIEANIKNEEISQIHKQILHLKEL